MATKRGTETSAIASATSCAPMMKPSMKESVYVARYQQLKSQQGPYTSVESVRQGPHPIPGTTAPTTTHYENVGSTDATGSGARTAAEITLDLSYVHVRF